MFRKRCSWPAKSAADKPERVRSSLPAPEPNEPLHPPHIIQRVSRLRSLAPGVVVCTLISLYLTVPTLQAQSAENVAVVINDNSEDSKRVGEHYAATR